MEELDPGAGRGRARRFRTTHWSLVRAARGGSTPETRAALSELCERYWSPVYAYIRRRGYSTSDAEDLTQEFFALLVEKDRVAAADPERGRFRSFLLAGVNHFLSNQRDHNRSARRRPSGGWIEIDTARAELGTKFEPIDPADPETLYLHDWATALVKRAAVRLEEEYRGKGRPEMFDRLGGFVTAEDDRIDYRTVARELRTGDVQVRVMVSRMRRRLRELVRQEVAQTVASPEEVESELELLRQALR